MEKFKLSKHFIPAGDQPSAIKSLTEGLKKGERHQVLLGVTGSGKTFTAANVIAAYQKPTLVIAHNKTLAAQLAQEYREFFPENAVHYFVSYYDYYQPEAYLPSTDTYIEKEAQINAEIERLRHASTQALLTRRDVIIVASVSCIYGLGDPEEYEKVHLKIKAGGRNSRAELIRKLVGIYFKRTNSDLSPGTFRALGNMVEIMPTNEKVLYRVEFDANRVVEVLEIDPISRKIIKKSAAVFVFPAKHFVTPEAELKRATRDIESELTARLKELTDENKILEAERLKRRTRYDLSMIKEIGYCNGIENYSRHFDGRSAGEPPSTLLSYFPTKRRATRNERGQALSIEEPDFLTIIDESHVTIPQLRGMYAGDRSRKNTLVEHGFRLPSARDNRPLTFEEFGERIGPVIYTSATPGDYEREISGNLAEQIIRPTGLVDPELVVRPIVSKGIYGGQVADFIKETEGVVRRGGRVLATTLTKKMAEDLAAYLKEKKTKAEYLHSDVKTLERIKILTEFRKGKFDVLVGVNLLREGLDLPEVELIGIFDADKEGFLRSQTSIIQTIGRAARNVLGRVILYADRNTGSLEAAISETNRRRALQRAYNKKHQITPKTIFKKIEDITKELRTEHAATLDTLLALDRDLFKKSPRKFLKEKEKQMGEAVKVLDFETAALIRDEIEALRGGGDRG